MKQNNNMGVYMQLSENALTVLRKRYFLKDENGSEIEDWDGLIDRVASNISKTDSEKYACYKRLLDSGLFLPNSPTLMNAGNDLQQLSACFVLPIEDSMESIFGTIRNAALIHKSGGGTGFSFSRLREANAPVKTTNGVSSGPLSFLKVFNAATDAVKQGGTRRGANMAILNVDHPQIVEFITAKEDTRELTNFNLSVGITDDFMRAVNQNDEYDLISPRSKTSVGKLNAQTVFTLIVDMAYKNGEPGVVFIDRLNQYNPTPHVGKIESTNPCGEQPLLPNEACNLGSINLSTMIKDNDIDWVLLKQVVGDSVSFLDDVIDCSIFPLPEIDEMVKANRKIGLGIMGWADLLFQLQIPYNSDEAITLAKRVMEFIDYYGKQKSMEIASIKGSFPNFKGSIYERGQLFRTGTLDWNGLNEKIKQNGLRNATVTTIAPTGTISMILNASSGIEPQFSLVFVKQVMDGEKLLYINPWFESAMKKAGLYTQELMEKVADTGSIAHIEEIPEDIRAVFVTAHDISPEWHIRMQASFQRFTDNAVSKTINFPKEATKEDIRVAFEMAYQLGCKGVTVYRDGSRENQVLNVGSSIKDNEKIDNIHKIAPRNRPEITSGITRKIETGCGHLYVTINADEQGPVEVFTQMGKVGGCASAQLEAIARLVSTGLRANVKLESLIRQLKGIRCPSPMWNNGKMVTSCADAVAQCMETFAELQASGNILSVTGTESSSRSGNAITKKKYSGVCPECGSSIEHTEGCMKCPSCGWSKC